MDTKEWVIIISLVLGLFTTIYAIGVKWINTWERIEREKDEVRIQSIVQIHVRKMVDEIKENYAEMVHLLKSGTFK